ncbi:hypothetical protein L873DRAFT_790224 [Choiromyces venosus 120613-1]|uniref:Uncharacterized protein n=1 Tax=Choiromyces venosus 120613-1 TaxID=1336337 RepID=A0A3N4K7H3_9PEZI|nr:hypothetical protein L873DRAFT_790224 [Choiromyces venosus 120613-1]
MTVSGGLLFFIFLILFFLLLYGIPPWKVGRKGTGALYCKQKIPNFFFSSCFDFYTRYGISGWLAWIMHAEYLSPTRVRHYYHMHAGRHIAARRNTVEEYNGYTGTITNRPGISFLLFSCIGGGGRNALQYCTIVHLSLPSPRYLACAACKGCLRLGNFCNSCYACGFRLRLGLHFFYIFTLFFFFSFLFLCF